MAPARAKRYRSAPASTIHQPTSAATMTDSASVITASVSASKVAPARVGLVRRATAPSSPSSSRATVARMVSGHPPPAPELSSPRTAQAATRLTKAARKTVTRSASPIGSAPRRRIEAARIITIPNTGGARTAISAGRPCPVSESDVQIRALIATVAASITPTTYRVKRRGRTAKWRPDFAAAIIRAYEREQH